MLDVRYHMIYLCAVFLMMGAGILIGEAVYPHQAKSQAKTLAALKQEADQAMQRGQAAQDQLSKTEQALGSLRPALVRGKLAGKRVIVILTGDYPDAVEAARGALADAGATVASTVTLTNKEALAASDENGPSPLPSLAALLAQGTAGQSVNQQARDSLESQGLISVKGDLSKPVSLFVLVGGGDGSGDGTADLDTALVDQLNTLTNNGVHVVGCEPLDAAVSSIQAYQDHGMATVDCIDQPLGQLALPFALRGETDSYGLKPTAARQLPASLEGSVPS